MKTALGIVLFAVGFILTVRASGSSRSPAACVGQVCDAYDSQAGCPPPCFCQPYDAGDGTVVSYCITGNGDYGDSGSGGGGGTGIDPNTALMSSTGLAGNLLNTVPYWKLPKIKKPSLPSLPKLNLPKVGLSKVSFGKNLLSKIKRPKFKMPRIG
uniref:Putative secreted protein n=1 Tax=Amblyomma triste TaxID=251400 RepID=A0A023G2S8_AMBTT